MKERRSATRRVFKEDFHAYIGTQRLDWSTMDISAGGAFFSTNAVLPLGTDVVVVFKKQASHDEPVFLAGRVVRRQLAPAAGVGVRWTKATTKGSTAHLQGFLSSILGIEAPTIVREREPDRRQVMSVFRFPKEGLPPVVLPEFDDAMSKTLTEATGTRDEQRGNPPGTQLDSRFAQEGAITRRIARFGLRAPASLPARLRAGAQTIDAMITHIGATGMFVQTPLPFPKDLRNVEVHFKVPLKSEDVELACSCRVIGSDDGKTTGTPGLDLEFLSVDEGSHQGILRKYVRWLHFRALSTL